MSYSSSNNNNYLHDQNYYGVLPPPYSLYETNNYSTINNTHSTGTNNNNSSSSSNGNDGGNNRNSISSSSSSSSSSSNGNSRNKQAKKKVSTRFPPFLKRKECMICVEKLSMKSFVIVSDNCDHDANICGRCISEYINSNLNDKGDINIKCPLPECGVILDSHDIKKLVKKDLYERYDELALRKALQQMPDIRWCKNSKCGSAQSHIGSHSEPILTCGNCGTKSCFTHDSLWHEGLTCQQFDELERAKNMATHEYLSKHTKPCPKCGIRISKNEGCDHMTCKVPECRYEFCWLCSANYDNIRSHGNHYHEESCVYYRPDVE